MLSEESKRIIASKSSLEFAAAVSELIEEVCNSESPHAFLKELFETIVDADLPSSEKSRRGAVIVKGLPHSIKTDGPSLKVLSDLPNIIKTGVISVLPPESLSSFYGTKEVRSPSQTQEETRKGARPSVSEEKVGNTQHSTVIIISSFENQETNISLLQNNRFGVFRATTIEELGFHLTNDDICGFVIEGSAWMRKSPEAQDYLLKTIAEYSSLSCIYVDRTHFHQPDKIAEIVSRARFHDPKHNQLLVRDSSILSQNDLPCFRASSNLIGSGTRPQILLADLSEPEIVALVSSATAFFNEELRWGSTRLQTLFIETIGGGQSEAKLFLVTFNGKGLPVVAKIGERTQILSEMERFSVFIRPWDHQLKPVVYFHRKHAVILFSVVEDGVNHFRPAPTLDSKINNAWLDEGWTSSEGLENECRDILRIITIACKKLELLNRQPCESSDFESYAFLRGSCLQKMNDTGIQWNLPLEGNNTIAESINNAHRILAPFREQATVHGDVHLRNILARGSLVASLIDYALSGPGHPAYDLIRFECALYFKFLRPLDTEDSFIQLQKAISVHVATIRELEADFKVWFSSQVNHTLLSGAVICRDQCLGVLKSYGLSKKDYIAAKFIMCCYSLSIPELQWSLIRGAIRALAPEVNASKGATA